MNAKLNVWQRWLAGFRGSHYRRSLITLLLFASLPGIVIGFILFIFSKSQIESELQSIHQGNLLQRASAMDEQFSFLERSIAYWAFDSQFTNRLKDLDLTYKYEEIHEIYRTLLVMEGANPLVERVELYVSEQGGLLFTVDGFWRLDGDRKERYERLLANEQSLFWNSSREPAEIRLIHKVPGIGAEPFGVLVMHLKKEPVLELVRSLTPYNGGTTFVYEASDGWLVTSTQNLEPSPLDRAILGDVQTRAEEAGTYIYDWNGETYSVTYGKLLRAGAVWQYASAAPLTTITAPIIAVSKWIMIGSAVVLLLAIALSYFASRRLYSPIDNLLKKMNPPKSGQGQPYRDEFEWIASRWNDLSYESETLKSRIERQLPQLKEGFLLQLLHGYLYSYTENELLDRMEHFGNEARNRRFSLAYIQLLGFSKLKGKFAEGDEGLVTFAATNIVEELMQSLHIQADVINFHDLSIGVLISLPNKMTREQFDEEVYRICEEIIVYVERILLMEATICISRTADSIKDVPMLFEETKMAVSFRNINDGKQIIDITKLESIGNDQAFDYPFDLEKQVLHAIRIGSEEDAVKLVREFVQVLSDNNPNEATMKQGTLHLLGSVMHVVLQSGMTTQQIYDGANLYEQLCAIREPDQVIEWFGRKVIHPFIHEFAQKQKWQTRAAIEKAMQMLHEQYQTDISLDSCADALKMSPFILSKTFKEVTGINFIDYLTNIRLEKARELLRDTDLKISEIAEGVGYQHSYFNRLFKKQEGVTPSQYREMSRPVS
ncbi:AraC family transcriptional regulator [Paenibacillus sp.]|uniref:AraC family transcriptional regulator n=1 Tax=Paenibacillus sp. TaxID=58172 RepID=UPI002D70B145|nr:AraC family transcriptional regulator [Paenibacillus sp.]HZG86646.1 AraC family transcriptional regulator [Paenibacillus sp.]